jgi:HTH-type transcriptional regulator / antitoxin HipB
MFMPVGDIGKICVTGIYLVYVSQEYFMKIIVHTPAGLGEILQSARKSCAMTQAQAAARIGIGQPRLSALETTGTASISLDQMLALLALYGLELCVQSRGAPAEGGAGQPEW